MSRAEHIEILDLQAWAQRRQETPQACRGCGEDVPEVRRIYTFPVCYECLPAPEPLPLTRDLPGRVVRLELVNYAPSLTGPLLKEP